MKNEDKTEDHAKRFCHIVKSFGHLNYRLFSKNNMNPKEFMNYESGQTIYFDDNSFLQALNISLPPLHLTPPPELKFLTTPPN